MRLTKFGYRISLVLLSAVAFSCRIWASGKRPNLIVIQTDEHNFRTLGCYRELMSDDQAYIWGEGVEVDTPHIDTIAQQGAICTSYYAASPVCTPSRASLMSGLYPQATGSPNNDMPLNDDIVTFAEILRREGYATSYVGKWHLDGDEKPGFAPERKFGFEDNRYMFNRVHWKLFQETEEGPNFIGSFNVTKNSYQYDIGEAYEESFATDFLVDRSLEIIERDKDQPFCLMLAIPDPHGPNSVRAPYDEMYTHMFFENPTSMAGTLKNPPKWNSMKGKNQVFALKQRAMAQYFGMVKCIDDNVGKLLKYLKDQDLERNTIVVFTSDHGDLMGEHCRHNKGLPYETLAGISFLIRYPEKIDTGKIVHSAQTNVDFVPTILSLMDVKNDGFTFHGRDNSEDFLNDKPSVIDEEFMYYGHAGGQWTAAVNHRYKLVLSTVDEPWFFDLEKDPDESVNVYRNPDYAPFAKRAKKQLIELMELYEEPIWGEGKLRYE